MRRARCEKPDMPKADNVIGSQFRQPYLEFSGSCAGCAETSYARLVTQLFGDHMMISNATGCSSIWGGLAATSPYTVNKEGKGPSWANLLFEDNAEHGLGLYLGQKKIRDGLKAKVEAIATRSPRLRNGLRLITAATQIRPPQRAYLRARKARLRLRYPHRAARKEGLPQQEELLDLRRRRLGL